MWAKIITIKRTKDLNHFSQCALHEFHNLSWITEINELFHDILIYWDAPVNTKAGSLFTFNHFESWLTNWLKQMVSDLLNKQLMLYLNKINWEPLLFWTKNMWN